MSISKNNLKQWFVRGAKPLAAQFAAWIDSYWHKDEKIPATQIDGLQEAFDSKADSEAFNSAVQDLKDNLAQHDTSETAHQDLRNIVNRIDEKVAMLDDGDLSFDDEVVRIAGQAVTKPKLESGLQQSIDRADSAIQGATLDGVPVTMVNNILQITVDDKIQEEAAARTQGDATVLESAEQHITGEIGRHNTDAGAHNNIRQEIIAGNFSTLTAAAQDATNKVSSHNADNNSHADIRQAVNNTLDTAKAYTEQKIGEMENRLVHDFGAFASPIELQAAYPTANPGDMALVQSTDTVWVWSSAASSWIDSDKKGEVSDAQFRAHSENSSVHVSVADKNNWNNKANEISSFAEAASRANINTGESVSTIFGKIRKWFSELKAVAFSGSYRDLSDTPASLPANGGTADYSYYNKIESVSNLNIYTVANSLPKSTVVTYLGNNVIGAPNDGWFYFKIKTHSGVGWIHITAYSYGGDNTINEVYHTQQSGTAAWSGWRRDCDGGNADTVDGKHASDLLAANGTFTGDWNTLVTPTMVNIEGFAGQSNHPSGAYPYGVLSVFNAGNGNGSMCQIYAAHAGSEIWCRTAYYSSMWYPWVRLANTGEIPTQLPMQAKRIDGTPYDKNYRPIAEYNTKGDGYFYITTQDSGDSVNYRDKYSIAKAYIAEKADRASGLTYRQMSADLYDWLPTDENGLFYSNAPNAAHAPTSGWLHYIGKSHANPSRYCHITAYTMEQGSRRQWEIECVGGTWGNWREVAHMDDIPISYPLNLSILNLGWVTIRSLTVYYNTMDESLEVNIKGNISASAFLGPSDWVVDRQEAPAWIKIQLYDLPTPTSIFSGMVGSITRTNEPDPDFPSSMVGVCCNTNGNDESLWFGFKLIGAEVYIVDVECKTSFTVNLSPIA